MYLEDKPNDVWSSFKDSTMMEVVYEDGTVEPFTTNHIVMTYGQFQGMKLGEIMKVSYLEWLKESSINKKDDFTKIMCERRLYELQE